MARKVSEIAADLGMSVTAARTWLKDNGVAVTTITVDTTPRSEGALKSTERIDVVMDAKSYFDARRAKGIKGAEWLHDPYEPAPPPPKNTMESRVSTLEAKAGIVLTA